MVRFSSPDELKRYREELRAGGEKRVNICTTGCRARGAIEIAKEMRREAEKAGVRVVETGCQGLCARAPVMTIEPDGIFYVNVEKEDAKEIAGETLVKNRIVERLLYDKESRAKEEIPFFKEQKRIVLRNCGRIDPKEIDEYVARDGYAAIERILRERISPESIIEGIKRSKLRGRGGAGFPTGLKWELTRKSKDTPKYLVCNGDEGDPGAFMDRAVLEGDPHSVIEGMIIGAYAIGASQGYIYVRAEYPVAVENLNAAISQAREYGLLGSSILGTDFSFDIGIKKGAGAFVCGEETALMASVEGRRGTPRPRPPFPAQKGLWNKPTCINNVETFANVPWIILNGAEKFARMGTERSGGTKIFSLAGKVKNTGLVEVPIGTTLRKIIFDIGGGVSQGKKFKAVQIGGPSGGCLPERFLDLPVDYESMKSAGAIMGSGGMIVLDDSTCMVELARFFMEFVQSESCGKCTPCRVGTKRMLEILENITEGRGKPEELGELEELANVVKDTSLCGLGQTAPNSVLTTLRYFRDEYIEHIVEKHCPAAACEDLMIAPCQSACPAGIDVPRYITHIASCEYSEAVETIREYNPFPAVCGRICDHPCEQKCRRAEVDEPVAIRELKRFAADWYFEHLDDYVEPFPRTIEKKVAVVGAGPAGLTCAYFLAKMGYGVCVFEALPFAGGMLSIAIPEFRLPKWVVEKEVEYIKKRGVEIRFNTPIDVNFTVEKILKSFDAVFIAAGAQQSLKLGVKGEEEGIEGFYYGLKFLRDVKVGKPLEVGKRVIVIGGGNVALDVARICIRLGASSVSVYYRRSRGEMPVTDEEYDEAISEGVKMEFLTSPLELLREGGRATGMKFIRNRLGEVDEGGRRAPIPIEGSEFSVEAEAVIAAVGQAADLSFLPSDTALERTKWKRLKVDRNTLSTSVKGVFAGGDFVGGPGMVIEAIASGRRASLAIDAHLRGETSEIALHEMNRIVEVPKRWETEEGARIRSKKLKDREGFAETELGFSEEEAKIEARRCLRCDLEGE
jgi:NADH-quinone oxidoreductase subunit F